MATHPLHEGQGAASMLVKWGIDRCTAEHVPGFLESTVAAGRLYRRHGFNAVEDISMELEQKAEDGTAVVYRETTFLFTPSDI